MGLRVAGLGKDFAGTPALHDLSHGFRPGAVTAVLGRSGCGKSTTLALIAGLLRPDRGRVCWDDHDLARVPAERRDSALVFQEHALFPHLRVIDNVAFGLRARGVDRRERRRRAGEALAAMRAEHLAERRIRGLSGGERQRVALARALAVRPRCLLLDEPFGALDAGLRDELRLELAGYLAGSDITTVLVTHDRHEACQLGAELLVLDRGRLHQAADPETCLRRPADAVVARSLGAGALLPARRIEDGCELLGRRVPVAAAGAATGLAVIPAAALRLAPAGSGDLQGRCRHAWYDGNAWRCRIAVDDDHAVEALAATPPAPGADCGLALRAEELWIVPAADPVENPPATSPKTTDHAARPTP